MELYYFPMDLIRQGSRVAIYGAGTIGKEFMRWNKINGYCDITVFFDQKAENILNLEGISVVNPEKHTNYYYDYILIAAPKYQSEIYSKLMELKIEKGKMIVLSDVYKIPSIEQIQPEKNGLFATTMGQRNTWSEYYQSAKNSAEYQIIPIFCLYLINII